MANDEYGRLRWAGDRTKIVREGEDGPAVVDRTEISVGSVGELAVADELRTDDSVRAALPRRALSLWVWVSYMRVCIFLGGATYVQGGVVCGTICSQYLSRRSKALTVYRPTLDVIVDLI